jgi:deazaflavin-dependent oxidoreductase (nitroreductase family)
MKEAPSLGPQGPTFYWFKARPSGLLRLALRLPVYLYRLNLDWLFGHRCLLLVHRGRKSGLLRETVLEVIRYDSTTTESIVLSGWGEKANWYRNIEASPALEIKTGGRRYSPVQRFLASEENQPILDHYAWRHPLVFRFLIRVSGFGYPLGGTQEERREFAHTLRLVSFRPAAGEADEPIKDTSDKQTPLQRT